MVLLGFVPHRQPTAIKICCRPRLIAPIDPVGISVYEFCPRREPLCIVCELGSFVGWGKGRTPTMENDLWGHCDSGEISPVGRNGIEVRIFFINTPRYLCHSSTNEENMDGVSVSGNGAVGVRASPPTYTPQNMFPTFLDGTKAVG